MTQTTEVNTIDIAKLNLKEGDILFVNADSVDIEAFRKASFYQGVAHVVIVPVMVPPGMSVTEQLAVAYVEAANERPNG